MEETRHLLKEVVPMAAESELSVHWDIAVGCNFIVFSCLFMRDFISDSQEARKQHCFLWTFIESFMLEKTL